ncbi:unnamed protein product [Ceutorhynchus assimilis]|uniref:MADF domain-containing protein n=1 Tax=Ceutorhynchus assimilis TaxID=467358 RepID=A0A9N9QDZ0_9CUCU|nr:unnamed protein product [Ceutorhynchus assimilis]
MDFCKPSSLRAHVKRKHPDKLDELAPMNRNPSGSGNHLCSECGKCFASFGNLRLHVKHKHSETNLVIDINQNHAEISGLAKSLSITRPVSNGQQQVDERKKKLLHRVQEQLLYVNSLDEIEAAERILAPLEPTLAAVRNQQQSTSNFMNSSSSTPHNKNIQPQRRLFAAKQCRKKKKTLEKPSAEEADINQYKFGYCGFFINSECENLLEHQCFIDFFNEEDHELMTDDNNVLTVVMKNTGTKVSKANSLYINSIGWEEHFISLVQERPGLYNMGLPVLQRTNAKKLQLWSEISNIFGNKISADELAKKWKYFRDCYIRAKKKKNVYQTSSSGAMPLPDPGFRHYYLMKFIDDGESQQTTISSVATTPTSIKIAIPGTSGSSTPMPGTLRTSPAIPRTSPAIPCTSPAIASSNDLFCPTGVPTLKSE